MVASAALAAKATGQARERGQHYACNVESWMTLQARCPRDE